MTIHTRLPSEERINPQDARRIQIIRTGILAAGDALRARNPWLAKHQDAIGMSIFIVASLGVIANAVAYGYGLVPFWVAIPLAAFCMSFLHELEHDLIHSMYFRKNTRVLNFMMGGVWLFRPSTISPWVRRRLHIHHHKRSGTESDLEERGITNGEQWGLKRLIMTGDNLLAVYLRPFKTHEMMQAFLKVEAKSKEEARQIRLENILGYFPLGVINYAFWHGFVVYHAAALIAAATGHAFVLPAIAQTAVHVMDFFVVAISAPNALRTFCLHFVSSNMHYYGDVETGNVVQQCQVWTSPWLIPLHLFCFNFAGTHAIHHFVVRDPFYVRQAIAKSVYPLLRENGVRFDDYGTFKRANRFYSTVTAPVGEAVTA
jgi:fatty acid desaturase